MIADRNTIHEFSTRRSIRRFLSIEVPREVLERILEAATWAPSAHNRQPWRFVMVIDLQAKGRLAQALGEEFIRDLLKDGIAQVEAETLVERSRQRIMQAPVLVMVCADLSVMETYPDATRQQAEYLMAVQSVAMAGENLLLAAHRENLGGVWMCAPLFAPDTVRQVLALPTEWEPQGMILLGYPETIPGQRLRRSWEDVTRWW